MADPSQSPDWRDAPDLLSYRRRVVSLMCVGGERGRQPLVAAGRVATRLIVKRSGGIFFPVVADATVAARPPPSQTFILLSPQLPKPQQPRPLPRPTAKPGQRLRSETPGFCEKTRGVPAQTGADESKKSF